MIVLYTSPGCASCRKAKKWLKENNIKFVEKNIFTTLLRENEIRYLLSRTENGIDDIVSTRSKVVKESDIDIEEMSISEIVSFIQNNPTALKRPIIINEKNMLVGYDEEEIEVFNTRQLRSRFTCECTDECPNYDEQCGKLQKYC